MAGRPKGSKNKRTLELQEAVAASGETPLDYMLRVMRDPTVEHDRRDEMAKACAPYLHARLSQVESKNETTVRYVARVPDKANTGTQWAQQYAPPPTQH
jgi:hypothetical protein